METIYLVSEGAYLDYKNLGLFTDKEAAERMANHYTESRVEEWPVDKKVDYYRQGYHPYKVFMGDNGNEATAFPISDIGISEFGYRIWQSRPSGGSALTNICWAKSEEHAIKITNDLRVQLIANNQLYAE